MKSNQFALLLGFSPLGGCATATEETSFTVNLAKGDFEVRDYPEMVVAHMTAPVLSAAAII